MRMRSMRKKKYEFLVRMKYLQNILFCPCKHYFLLQSSHGHPVGARLIIILLTLLLLFWTHSGYNKNTNDEIDTKKCWLQDAFTKGDFIVYSHRSFVSLSDKENKPSCDFALQQLKDIGVNHLDLDLVYDEDTQTLFVAHPMEFKKESEYFSPCSLHSLNDLLQMLNSVYGEKWFISLEPKASWGRTEKETQDFALAEPIKIMSKLLEVLKSYDLNKSKCAVIVNVNSIESSGELITFQKILDHCQLFDGKRNTDIIEDTMDIFGFHYDKMMPTIEFHPKHARYQGLQVPVEVARESIFWVVDNEKDLLLATDFKPHGIVSNNPKEIVKILYDQSWCKLSN